MKWGKRYPSRHLSRPFHFVCLTDDTAGLIEGIETLPFPENPGVTQARHRRAWHFGRANDNAAATADATLQITVAGLPLPWVAAEIGTGMLAGSTTHNAGTFTQAGSGIIGSTADKLRFSDQTLTGDGEIIARISVLQNTGISSRVGMMIRDTLAANAKEIFMGMTGTNAYRWVRRTSTGGSSSNSSTGTVPNTWVRLVRSGTTITASKSINGTSWTTVGSTTNTSFASTCYIGLAVGSGSTITLNTSQVSNVSVTP